MGSLRFLRCSIPPDLVFCALPWPTGSWCPLKGVGKGERSLEGTRVFLISIVGKPRLSQITAGLPFGNKEAALASSLATRRPKKAWPAKGATGQS